MAVHMVQQIIKYSDGTQTVIDYKGEIVNGVLIPDEETDMSDENTEEVVAEDVVIDVTSVPEATTEEGGSEEVTSEGKAEDVVTAE